MAIVRYGRLVWLALDGLPIIALGWVLLHLVLLFRYGSVTIVEENRAILSTEIVVVIVGLVKSLTVASGLYRRYANEQ